MPSVKRREFITLLSGAAAASSLSCPRAARAQQSKVARLGYLEPQTPTDLVAANLRRQFLLGLRDLGYVEGRQFKMEVRSADDRLDRLPALASELARLRLAHQLKACRQRTQRSHRRDIKSSDAPPLFKAESGNSPRVFQNGLRADCVSDPLNLQLLFVKDLAPPRPGPGDFAHGFANVEDLTKHLSGLW